MEPKIGLGIPLSWPYCHSDFFDSFMLMEKPNCHVIRASSGPIDVMRNNIVDRALEMGCTHLVFLDADMVYPADAIPRLLSHNLSAVGALCFKRWPPFNPTLFVGEPYSMTLLDPYPAGLVEVTATGTACLMLDMDVFRRLESPWFKISHTRDGKPVGEDVGFCYRLKEIGVSVHVDTTIKCDHLANIRVNEKFYQLNKKVRFGF